MQRQFCDGTGQLWVFDRVKNELRHQHPRQTGAERDLYTIEKDGKPDASLEVDLMKYVDGKAVAPLRKLRDNEPITMDDRYYLAVFFAMLCVRGPEFVKMYKELVDKGAKAYLQEMNRYGDLERGFAEKGHDPEALRRYLDEGEFTVVPGKEETLARMTVEGLRTIAPHFFASSWSVGETSDDCCFITSDVPYSMISLDPAMPSGLTGDTTVRTIPISPHHAIVMGPPVGSADIERSRMPRDLVREINRDMAMGSDRFIYGRDKAHVKALAVRNRLAEWRRSERTHIKRFSRDGRHFIAVINEETPDAPPPRGSRAKPGI